MNDSWKEDIYISLAVILLLFPFPPFHSLSICKQSFTSLLVTKICVQCLGDLQCIKKGAKQKFKKIFIDPYEN